MKNKILLLKESQVIRLLENLVIFPDSNGNKIVRHEIVTSEDGLRWRVMMFMDESKVKCVGLDSENEGKTKVFPSKSLTKKETVDETTSIGSVGGGNGFGYDVPFPEIGTKTKKQKPIFKGGQLVDLNKLINESISEDTIKIVLDYLNEELTIRGNRIGKKMGQLGKLCKSGVTVSQVLNIIKTKNSEEFRSILKSDDIDDSLLLDLTK